MTSPRGWPVAFALVALLTGCSSLGGGDSTRAAGPVASPCDGVAPLDLGTPARVRTEPARFRLVGAGTVWVTATGYQPTGPFEEDPPYDAPVFIGRGSFPEGTDAEGVRAAADLVERVEQDLWTPVELGDGEHWLLVGGPATTMALADCGDDVVEVISRSG